MSDDFWVEFQRYQALHKAISDGGETEVQRLIRNVADVNQDMAGFPLNTAVRRGDLNIIRVVLESGAAAEVSLLRSRGTLLYESSLENAVKKGRASVVTLVLESIVLKKTSFSQDALDNLLETAIEVMRLDLIQLFFQYGAKLYKEKPTNWIRPKEKWLHRAAGWDGSEEVLLDFLSRGIYDVNEPQEDGQTALHLASVVGYKLGTLALLQSGADPNIRDNIGESVLDKSVSWHGLEDIQSILLKHGALYASRAEQDVNVSDLLTRFDTASMEAESNGDNSRPASSQGLSREEVSSPALGATPGDYDLDTSTFHEILRRLASSPLEPPMEGTRKAPRRLIDIHTGQIVAGTVDKKFVVVSYIWSPEKYALQDPMYFLDSHQSLLPGFFDDVVNYLMTKDAEFVQKVPSTHQSILQPYASSAHNASQYFQEVYMLAAMEAERRGMDYVWMDSLCIDQSSHGDKEAEIPFMSEYYRNAECCVVISELLRRKLCICWRDIRHNRRKRPKGPDERLFDWLLPKESLLAWIIGYHHHRVWTFQETFLAREVIVCGSGLRIDATRLVKDRTEQHSTTFYQGNERFSILAKHFPLRNSTVSGAIPLSLSHCLNLLSRRECSLPHDRIYGILGLLPSPLRSAVPVDYDVSLGAALANYAFVSICGGELVNLFLLRATDSKPHGIANSPSWLPTGYSSPFESIVDMVAHPDLRFSAQASRCRISLHMQYLVVSDVRTRGQEHQTDKLHWGNHDTVARLLGSDGHALPFLAAVAVEPVHHWHPTEKVPEAVKAENDTRRQRIQHAAGKGCAVMATFGIRKLTGNWSRPDMGLWLLLGTDDGGETWRKEGIGITGKLPYEMNSTEFVIC